MEDTQYPWTAPSDFTNHSDQNLDLNCPLANQAWAHQTPPPSIAPPFQPTNQQRSVLGTDYEADRYWPSAYTSQLYQAPYSQALPFAYGQQTAFTNPFANQDLHPTVLAAQNTVYDQALHATNTDWDNLAGETRLMQDALSDSAADG